VRARRRDLCPHEPAARARRREHLRPPSQRRGTLVVETRFDGWEKPWRALTPEDWDDLALEFGERVLLGTIDTGRNRAFASRHGAEIVPEVLVFSRGEIVARFQGSADVRAIARAVREVLRHDRVLSEASRELAATDTSTARSVHRTRSRRRRCRLRSASRAS
jgi:thioredoxin-like negative regulator of GroEL